MKVIPDPAIRGFSGRFPKSTLVMMHRKNKTVSHAHTHFIPDSTHALELQAAFTEKAKAIAACWNSRFDTGDDNFEFDLNTYLKQYNAKTVKEDQLPVTPYAMFSKMVHAGAKKATLDVKDLTPCVASASNLATYFGDAAENECTVALILGYLASEGLPQHGLPDTPNPLTFGFCTGNVV